MKTTMLLLFAFLLACASASAQLFPPSDCRDNCGDFSGDCLACHITNRTIWFADYTYICIACNAPGIQAVPGVPFQAKPTDTLLTFIEKLTIKNDPNLARLREITPERHIELMRRAVRLGLDGPLLGSCRHSFKSGTLARLPGEIDATRRRLVLAGASQADNGPCVEGIMQCSDGTWVTCAMGCPNLASKLGGRK